jgi:3-dehydroquinate synthase
MKTIDINLGKRSYSVEIGKGNILLNGGILPAGHVITDKNVYKNYKKIIWGREESNYTVVEPGEDSKDINNYPTLLRAIDGAENIVALGGGVVGDIVGYIASGYKRGIPLIQIPTTLLAMVDSSIGGKNGFNLGLKKNYVGTIYQPNVVLTDLLFLNTLPREEFQNGVAEIIKYGAIFNNHLLEKCHRPIKLENPDLESIIAACVEIKKYFIEKDEHDKLERHTLNFGHTIGHALERVYGLSHGQAISIGMLKEAELGSNIGTLDRTLQASIKKSLQANNLPTKLKEKYNVDLIMDLIKADKKGKLVFAFSERYPKYQVEEDVVKDVLK